MPKTASRHFRKEWTKEFLWAEEGKLEGGNRLTKYKICSEQMSSHKQTLRFSNSFYVKCIMELFEVTFSIKYQYIFEDPNPVSDHKRALEKNEQKEQCTILLGYRNHFSTILLFNDASKNTCMSQCILCFWHKALAHGPFSQTFYVSGVFLLRCLIH
jgi:hypothetical protein